MMIPQALNRPICFLRATPLLSSRPASKCESARSDCPRPGEHSLLETPVIGQIRAARYTYKYLKIIIIKINGFIFPLLSIKVTYVVSTPAKTKLLKLISDNSVHIISKYYTLILK